MKKIAIMTTGGDCSGLNTTIERVMRGCRIRGWELWGILDGTDGLIMGPDAFIRMDEHVLPIENARLSGSVLRNGHNNGMNFEVAANTGRMHQYNQKIRAALKNSDFDALIIIGGNGSISLAWAAREIYGNLQLVCIPKTIDMDVPLTDKTIGFDTAVQGLTAFCDQLMLTARSHHRWFVVQAMGRDCGELALNAGIASGAAAILIPEIKFDTDELVRHIKHWDADYGIIIVAEGITLRGHSGRPADMIARKLSVAGIPNRTAFPEHTQRAGDTTATDRILATSMADAALHAIDNNETFVMTVLQNGTIKTVGLDKFYDAGEISRDPRIKELYTSNAYVAPDDPLLDIAGHMGIYIGSIK